MRAFDLIAKIERLRKGCLTGDGTQDARQAFRFSDSPDSAETRNTPRRTQGPSEDSAFLMTMCLSDDVEKS